jgi:hypothetical protein
MLRRDGDEIKRQIEAGSEAYRKMSYELISLNQAYEETDCREKGRRKG